jgi:hypothetical protein
VVVDHKPPAASEAAAVEDHKPAAATEAAAVEVEEVEVVVALFCHLKRPSARFLLLPLLSPPSRGACCCSALLETSGSRQ